MDGRARAPGAAASAAVSVAPKPLMIGSSRVDVRRRRRARARAPAAGSAPGRAGRSPRPGGRDASAASSASGERGPAADGRRRRAGGRRGGAGAAARQKLASDEDGGEGRGDHPAPASVSHQDRDSLVDTPLSSSGSSSTCRSPSVAADGPGSIGTSRPADVPSRRRRGSSAVRASASASGCAAAICRAPAQKLGLALDQRGRSAATTRGQNCVPALSCDLGAARPRAAAPCGTGRSLVIASSASATERIRAASGISSPTRPSG